MNLAIFLAFSGFLSVICSEVITLNAENFESETHALTGDNGSWFVKFYAPWCGHCQNLAPTWEEASIALKGVVNVAKLDVTANEIIGARFEIQYFPMLKFIHGGLVYSFDGDRSLESIIHFATEGFKSVEGTPVPWELVAPEPEPTDVIKMDIDNIDELTHISSGEAQGVWLIKFYAPWCSACQEFAKLYEEYATLLKDRVNVAEVDVSKNMDIAKKFGITHIPALKLLKGNQYFDFKGDRNERDWVIDFATGAYVEKDAAFPLPDLGSDEAVEEVEQSGVHDEL